ncbi:hypothetical protein [Streptomyces sp. NPDC048665]|uniref:hypothetical protein n=1 Tax=Streptomyces sp. NPDC048665 TaxID=3155490 RepID=UPI0034419AEB
MRDASPQRSVDEGMDRHQDAVKSSGVRRVRASAKLGSEEARSFKVFGHDGFAGLRVASMRGSSSRARQSHGHLLIALCPLIQLVRRACAHAIPTVLVDSLVMTT